MVKFNNILIPIDFSGASILALKYGLEIAKINNSKVHVLHAFRLIDSQKSIRNNEALALRNKLKDNLKGELKHLKSTYADSLEVQSTFDLQIGFPEDVIESFLISHPIDVIILSTTGTDNCTSQFGSTFSAVVKNHNTAVIAIPKNANHSSLLTQKNLQLADTSGANHLTTITHSYFSQGSISTKKNLTDIFIIETKT